MTKQSRQSVLLMGPPNVGKSVLFNQLTGMNVSCANYAGTTVEVAIGTIKLDAGEVVLIDVPGTYTLDANNQAEEIAIDMLKGIRRPANLKGRHCAVQTGANGEQIPDNKPSMVLCVLDACNLESSLYLLLQIMRYQLPTAAIVNRVDLAQERGERIDTAHLSRELGIRVIPTIATTGEGSEQVRAALLDMSPADDRQDDALRLRSVEDSRTADGELWQRAEELARQSIVSDATGGEKAETRRKWGLLLVQPWPGIPLAALILAATFGLVVGLGMGLRQLVLLPLFRDLILPAISSAVATIVPPGIIQNILIGEYGFLIKGLEWPFALVLPYVISFYLALSLLEDSGYMPRLGALLDGLLRRIGLRGSSVIPLLLGYGCGIPAIMATRTLESEKQRVMLCTMICVAVPCIAQTGAFISLLAEVSLVLVASLFALSFLVLAVAGLLMDLIIKGTRQNTVMEIPEMLLPRPDVVSKKVWIRIKSFVTDGALPMVGAVGLGALLYESGAMSALGQVLSPLVTNWLMLPQEAAVPLVLGVVRREMAVLPLMGMNLTALQLFVGAAVGLFYVPCIAVVAVVARQFNLKTALGMLLLTMTIAFLIGGLIARAGALLI